MLKTIITATAVMFCTAAGFFCVWAATLIVHIPGWQVVQAGVVAVGIFYFLGAILILEIASRSARRANGGR